MTWFPEEFGENKADRQRNLAEWLDVSEQMQVDEGDVTASEIMPGDTDMADEGLDEDLLMDEQGMHIEEFLPGIDHPVTRDIALDPLLDAGLLEDEDLLDPEPTGMINSDDELNGGDGSGRVLTEDAFVDDDILMGDTGDDADVMVMNTAPDETDVDEDDAILGGILNEGALTGVDLEADTARGKGNDAAKDEKTGRL